MKFLGYLQRRKSGLSSEVVFSSKREIVFPPPQEENRVSFLVCASQRRKSGFLHQAQLNLTPILVSAVADQMMLAMLVMLPLCKSKHLPTEAALKNTSEKIQTNIYQSGNVFPLFSAGFWPAGLFSSKPFFQQRFGQPSLGPNKDPFSCSGRSWPRRSGGPPSPPVPQAPRRRVSPFRGPGRTVMETKVVERMGIFSHVEMKGLVQFLIPLSWSSSFGR